MSIDEYLAEARRRQDTLWPQDVPREVVYPLDEISIGDHVRHWATTQPEAVAYLFYGASITWAQLDEMSDRVAGWLQSHGVHTGDRVGVMLPNSPQFVIAFIAIMKLGAVHVPINTMFKELELAHELIDADVSVLFALDSMLDILANVIDQTKVKHVVVTSAYELVPAHPQFPLPQAPPAIDVERFADAPRWADVLTAQPASAMPIDLDALAALNYTGGTTGLPKGCEHSQRHMLYTAATALMCNKLSEHPVFLCHVPIFWIAGEDFAILNTIVSGGTCVLMARWDPAATIAAIDTYGVEMFVATVDNYLELMRQPTIAEADFSSLTSAATMSFVTRMSPEIRQQWAATARGSGVLREAAYGMTETHTCDTFTYGLQRDDWDLVGEPGQCGLPMPGTDFMVVSPGTIAPLAFGERGEIVLRSPSILTGYWRKPEATEQAIENGWLHTGDTGFIDEAGCVHYLSRDKDMIKVNGMSVFPTEVETFLCRHADVEVAAVVPCADPAKGQVPVAFVKLTPGATISEADLRSWAKSQMANYKVPSIRFVEQYPMTTTGKIKKAELANLLI